MSDTRDVQIRVIIDVILLLVVGSSILVLNYAVVPLNRGFYCRDELISYPYHSDTISSAAAGIIAVLASLSIVLAFELGSYFLLRRSKSVPESGYSLFGRPVPFIVVSIYLSVGALFFGMAACQSVTDFIKILVGRLRPHFLDVCQPDYSRINCTDSNNQPVYITDTSVCTAPINKRMIDARKSFPSGHASLAAYTSFYLAYYIHKRFTWRRSLLLKHVMQILCVYYAIYISLSRISDYKHHPTDVLAGFIIGVIIATLNSVCVSNLFHKVHRKVLRADESPSHSLNDQHMNRDVETGRAHHRDSKNT